MNNYYVYQLIDPRDGLPFYIGKGTGNRCFKHLKETYKTTENKKKYSRIKRLSNLGLKIIIDKISINLTEQEAYNLEALIIKELGRKGIDTNGILLNICIDNRPPRNTKKWSEERKKLFSEQRSGNNNPMYGKSQSEKYYESRTRMNGEANPFYGKTHSEETRNKVRESNIRRKGIKYKRILT